MNTQPPKSKKKKDEPKLTLGERIKRRIAITKAKASKLAEKFTFKRQLLVWAVAAVVVAALVYKGTFSTAPQSYLPTTAAKLPALTTTRLQELIASQPAKITSVTFYKNLDTVSLVWEGKQSYIVKHVDTHKLAAELDAAKVSHIERDSVTVPGSMSVWFTLIVMALIGSLGYSSYRRYREHITKTRVYIAIIVLAACTVPLNWVRSLDLPPQPILPESGTSATAGKQGWLNDVLAKPNAEVAKSIASVIGYEGFTQVVVYLPNSPTGYRFDFPDTDLLVNKLRDAGVKYEVQAPAYAPALSPVWLYGLWVAAGTGTFFSVLGLLFAWSAKRDANKPKERAELVVDDNGEVMYKKVETRGDCKLPDGDPKSWDDVGGNEEAIPRLKRIQKWIMRAYWYKLCGAKPPKGILMLGPPGTGKTLIAKILAWVCGCNFFTASGSDFIEKLVGVGASRVRGLFEDAQNAWKRNGKISIIFIDELDAVGGKRSGGEGSGGNREHDQTVTALLTCLDGYGSCPGIIVLATTNHPDALDKALIRPGRFDYQVTIEMPDIVGREKIFAIHTRKMQLAENVDLHALAVRTAGMSGAQIELVCSEAAMMMAERLENEIEGFDELDQEDLEALPRLVNMDDLYKAVDYVFLGDPLLSRMRSQTAEERRNIEIHEAGHAIMNDEVGYAPPSKLTRVIHTKSLGHFSWEEERERYGYSDKELRSRIMCYLGGRIAQQVVLNYRDTAPSADFQMAGKLARQMVGIYGLCNEGKQYDGYDFECFSIPLDDQGFPTKAMSPGMHAAFEKAWMEILSECKSETVKILTRRKADLNRVADALEAKETINGEELRELLKEQPAPDAAEAESQG